MNLKTLIILTSGALFHSTSAVPNDCSMSDTTRCDCTSSREAAPPNLWGTRLSTNDCRVCRIGYTQPMELFCVAWGTNGERYGPLCEDPDCVPGSSSSCYCDWRPKPNGTTIACASPGGPCKCSTTKSNLRPASGLCETCDINGTTYCVATGDIDEGYGPICAGTYEDCKDQTDLDCFCNWRVEDPN